MKKLVCVFLMVACIFALSVGAFAAGGATIALSDASAKVGETIEVEIDIVNNPGIAGFEIDSVIYDSAVLEWTGLKWGFSGETEGSVGGELTWWGNSSGTNMTGDFCFAVLSFKVLDVPEGGKTTVSVKYDQANTFNDLFEDVVFSVDAAEIAVGHDCVFVEKVDDHCLVSAATCKSPAVYYKSCSVCGAHSTATFTAGEVNEDNHVGGTLTEVGKKAATCTEDGLEGNTVCASCERVLHHGNLIEKLGHTGGTATCKDKAVCDRCGEAYGEKNAANHVGSEVLRNEKAATCTEEGYTGDKVCSSCDTVLVTGTSIDKIPHAGGTATCVSGAICDTCGNAYGEKNPANHADKKLDGAKDATCTENGSTGTGKCGACGEELAAAEVIPALGHTGGEATCESAAVCTRCKETYGEKNPANHTALKAVAEKAATCTQTGTKAYWHCDGCDLYYADAAATEPISQPETIEKIAHTGGTATCANAAVCTACGQAYGEKDPGNHENWFAEEAVKASCSAEGMKAYWCCEDCGKYYTDKEMTQEIAKADLTVAKDPAYHANSDLCFHEASKGSCSVPGNIAYLHCVGCGMYWTVPEGFDSNELGEDFDFSTLTVLGTGDEAKAETVTEGDKDYHTCYKYDATGHWTTCNGTNGEVMDHKMNTETTGGKKTSTCALCGYTVIENISGGSESPKTGDEANIALWTVMFLMAGAGVAVLSLKKKEN